MAASIALLLAASVGTRHCADCNGFLDLIDGDTPYPLMRCVAGSHRSAAISSFMVRGLKF
ncbi:hypothetical protein PQQ51_04125 [Paraburkholderia xenovorans]|uniref:hypothetical protein n=1 Tax=Paraburkholderia xenovorans TaxID=36873 RepID=UPI0038BCEB06